MDLSALAQLEPSTLRQVLPGYLAGHIAEPDAGKRNRVRVGELVQTWSDDECLGVIKALTTGGDGFRVFAANRSLRVLSRIWSRDAIPSNAVNGLNHLSAAANAGPTVVLCNHLSYYDATATDAVVAWAGASDLANRLLFAAGPKVYTHLFRRVASSCLNTVQVPQSVKLSHTDRLTVRQLAEQALSSLKATERAVTEQGMILLLYPEGTRTRNRHMQPFLKGVHRYLALGEGVRVVPAAITGTDNLMSVDDDERIAPSAVTLTFGEALRVGADGSSREVLTAAHARIAALLPVEHQPEPGTSPVS